MLGAKPAVFISHSEQFREQVAVPLRDFAESLGMVPILVSEMPSPEQASSEPDAKVDYYLDKADMFVGLLTPDEKLDSGVVHTRHNITDELSRARSRRHLQGRIQVFKQPQVELHSNINPTYEKLDLSDVPAVFPVFERQAVKWELIEPSESDRYGEPAEGPIGPLGSSDEGGPGAGSIDDPATKQAVNAVEELRGYLLNDDPERPAAPRASVARAHLAASVALASVRSTELYGVHELNGLFRERASVELTEREERHLARRMLASWEADNAPGWYWLRGYSARAIRDLVVECAVSDPDSGVRHWAIKVLAAGRDSLDSKRLREVVVAALENEEHRIQAAGLSLLEAHGALRFAKLLEPRLAEISGGPEALLAVRARETPSAALRALIGDPSKFTGEIEQQLLRHVTKLPASLLRSALKVEKAEIQLLAMRALSKSSRLRKADLERFLGEEPASKVSKEAARIAVRRRWKIDRESLMKASEEELFDFGRSAAVRISYYRTQPIDTLRKELDWIGNDNANMYAAIGEMDFAHEAEQIRVDIRTDFERLRTAYREKVEGILRNATEGRVNELSLAKQPSRASIDKLVEKEVSEFFKDSDSLDQFVIRQFRIAALRVFANCGLPEDAEFARRFLGDRDEVSYECVRVFERCGSAEDADCLVDIASKMRGDQAVKAANAALKLSADKSATALALLRSKKAGLVLVGLTGLDELPLKPTIEGLEPLLTDPQASVRRAAAEYLVRRVPPGRHAELINFYVSGNSYYFYNVVVAIDRMMFAPAWITEAAKQIDS